MLPRVIVGSGYVYRYLRRAENDFVPAFLGPRSHRVQMHFLSGFNSDRRNWRRSPIWYRIATKFGTASGEITIFREIVTVAPFARPFFVLGWQSKMARGYGAGKGVMAWHGCIPLIVLSLI